MPSLEDLTTDQLLDHARRADAQNALFVPLMADPETRAELLPLLRKKHPTMPLPELDARTELAKLRDEERTAREKLAEELRSERLTRQLAEARDRVKKDHDLSDADLLEVEKLMTDEKAPIPHYDAAAMVFKASRAQAVPTTGNLEARTYDMPSKDVWGRGIANPGRLNKIALEQAAAALNDITSGRVKVA